MSTFPGEIFVTREHAAGQFVLVAHETPKQIAPKVPVRAGRYVLLDEVNIEHALSISPVRPTGD